MTAIISQESHKLNLATQIVSREREVYQYQMNIDNYTIMLQDLPTDAEWPAELIQYKGVPDIEMADKVPFEHLEMVTDLAFRDRLRSLLVTEKIEQGKARRVLNALKAQIPEEELPALIELVLAGPAQ